MSKISKSNNELKKVIEKIEHYSDKDYEKIGLKCGLEIHQQLNTRKLFCNCPTDADDSYDFEVRRHLNMSLSETNEKDKAAEYETKKDKTFIYRGNSKTVCLVELDEEPPHEINEDAFKIAIQACKLFHMKIIDEVQVMRKIVLDGSNTTGFQRTMLVGLNGEIKGTAIDTLCLEEDASKIIEQKDNETIYHLNRLGIPLIEVATDASIHSPKQAQEVARGIGLTLRSLNVKRGLGTIRQDVNVSIKEGNRVEIKGVQDLRSIPEVIKYEILRQKRLLELKEKVKDKINDNFKLNPVELTSIMKKSNSKIVKAILNNKNNIFMGSKIDGFKGILGFELQPNKRFGTELAGQIKRIGLKGLFHSDELNGEKYGINSEIINKIKSKLEVKSNDGFIVIGGSREQLNLAFEILESRIIDAKNGVPKEVRKANPDFTTSFLRPMPGASRMYPETDVPPKNTKAYLNIEVPESILNKIEKLKEKGLNEKEAEIIAKELPFFDEILSEFSDVKFTKLTANLMTLAKHKIHEKEIVRRIIKEFSEKNLSEDVKEDIIRKIESINQKDIHEKISELNKIFEGVSIKSIDEIKNEIDKEIMQYKNQGMNKGKIISLIMNKYKSQTNPRELIEYIKEKA